MTTTLFVSWWVVTVCIWGRPVRAGRAVVKDTTVASMMRVTLTAIPMLAKSACRSLDPDGVTRGIVVGGPKLDLVCLLQLHPRVSGSQVTYL